MKGSGGPENLESRRSYGIPEKSEFTGIGREFRDKSVDLATSAGAIRENANNFRLPISLIWISRSEDSVHMDVQEKFA